MLKHEKNELKNKPHKYNENKIVPFIYFYEWLWWEVRVSFLKRRSGHLVWGRGVRLIWKPSPIYLSSNYCVSFHEYCLKERKQYFYNILYINSHWRWNGCDKLWYTFLNPNILRQFLSNTFVRLCFDTWYLIADNLMILIGLAVPVKW